MRCFLTIISLLFITQSCFAKKPADSPALYLPADKKVNSLFTQLFSKAGTAEKSNICEDYFEHPTLIHQLLKKPVIACLQLFSRVENKEQFKSGIKCYAIVHRSGYDFLYKCLFPKHVFW
ncbi:MAG: hypothetical protein MUP99_07870 [Pedobacter sp.]|nr:hypothetical protein [Pedobacter sp.]